MSRIAEECRDVTRLLDEHRTCFISTCSQRCRYSVWCSDKLRKTVKGRLAALKLMFLVILRQKNELQRIGQSTGVHLYTVTVARVCVCTVAVPAQPRNNNARLSCLRICVLPPFFFFLRIRIHGSLPLGPTCLTGSTYLNSFHPRA